MSKTDGEYELVLGNRQLLSAFFIIVILFGVFFTMGYVVGRNSAPASAASATAPNIATSVRPDAAAPANTSPSQPAPTSPSESAKQPPVETKPVATPEKTDAAPPARRTPTPASERAAAAMPGGSDAGAPTVTPGPGRMYLQVAAAAQPQAGVVVDTLKQKGFPALLAQGPNATLFRVLVGPYSDAAQLGKAKADLESAGFHPMVRK